MFPCTKLQIVDSDLPIANLEIKVMNRSDGEVDRASVSAAVDSGFDSESGQTNDLKIGIHSFPA